MKYPMILDQLSIQINTQELIDLHDNIMYYLFIILFAVFWIIINYVHNRFRTNNVNFITWVMLFWILIPTIILVLIAFVVSSGDVIHSFAYPSSCINCETYPGILTQLSIQINTQELIDLHDNIMYYLFIILFAVFWIIINYVHNKISNKYVNHETLIELTLNDIIVLIPVLILFTSIIISYLIDEVIDPSLTLFTEGHQWYWSYEYPDLSLQNEDEIIYDSYLIPESDLEEGELRMLEVDGLTLYMNNAGNNPVGGLGVQNPNNVIAGQPQPRPISDLRWSPLEKGCIYFDEKGNPQQVRTNSAFTIYDLANPEADVPSLMISSSGKGNHVTRFIGNTGYNCHVKLSSVPKGNSAGVFRVNEPKFAEFAGIYNVTSNGTPVHPDTSGNIVIQKN